MIHLLDSSGPCCCLLLSGLTTIAGMYHVMDGGLILPHAWCNSWLLIEPLSLNRTQSNRACIEPDLLQALVMIVHVCSSSCTMPTDPALLVFYHEAWQHICDILLVSHFSRLFIITVYHIFILPSLSFCLVILLYFLLAICEGRE